MSEQYNDNNEFIVGPGTNPIIRALHEGDSVSGMTGMELQQSVRGLGRPDIASPSIYRQIEYLDNLGCIDIKVNEAGETVYTLKE